MVRTEVKSSNVKSIGFDLEAKTLEIEFKSGGIYKYYGISAEIYNSLMTAPSIGSYLQANIVRGGFECRKVGDAGKGKK